MRFLSVQVIGYHLVPGLVKKLHDQPISNYEIQPFLEPAPFGAPVHCHHKRSGCVVSLNPLGIFGA